MKRTIIKMFITLLILYVSLCGLLFVFQEKLIFFPQKLDKNFNFSFDQEFEEINIKSQDGTMPIVIFHGNQDEVIYYNSSIKLRKLLTK